MAKLDPIPPGGIEFIEQDGGNGPGVRLRKPIRL